MRKFLQKAFRCEISQKGETFLIFVVKHLTSYLRVTKVQQV